MFMEVLAIGQSPHTKKCSNSSCGQPNAHSGIAESGMPCRAWGWAARACDDRATASSRGPLRVTFLEDGNYQAYELPRLDGDVKVQSFSFWSSDAEYMSARLERQTGPHWRLESMSIQM